MKQKKEDINSRKWKTFRILDIIAVGLQKGAKEKQLWKKGRGGYNNVDNLLFPRGS
jgi:hypothetical protein